MPCSDGRDDVSEYAAQSAAATRAACELVRALRRYTTNLSELSATTRGWVRRHDDEDRRREAEEKRERDRKALRKKALAKLSPAERALFENRFI